MHAAAEDRVRLLDVRIGELREGESSVCISRCRHHPPGIENAARVELLPSAAATSAASGSGCGSNGGDRRAERRAAAHQRRVAAADRRDRGADLARQAVRSPPSLDLDPDSPPDQS